MRAPERVLVASASPDALNVNTALRHYLVRGFEQALPETRTLGSSYAAAERVARAFAPDLLVVFGSVMLDETDYVPLVERVKGGGGRVVFWLHDDPYEFDASFRVLPLADAVFTNDEACLDYYPPTPPVHHLPLGACRFTHLRPIVRRSGPDVFFCGHLYDNRRRFLERFARLAPDLDRRALFLGTGLATGTIPGWTQTVVANEELAGFHNAALAVLNIGRDLNLANHRFGVRASTPGPRTFEAALSGAAQIVVGDGLEIAEFFESEREVLLADTVEGFAEHWRRLLRDPDLSLALGRAAQERALAHHTYDHRARRIVELAYA